MCSWQARYGAFLATLVAITFWQADVQAWMPPKVRTKPRRGQLVPGREFMALGRLCTFLV